MCIRDSWFFFFFKQKTAYEISACLVGSEMCIRDRHNIPEGMAVGVVYAGYLAGNTQISAAAAMALSLGIAIQNFPEGAIISMPLRAEGTGKPKAFLGGVLSGIVEPIGAILTILAAGLIVPALPYLLSFAAGGGLLYTTSAGRQKGGWGHWSVSVITQQKKRKDRWRRHRTQKTL